MDYRIFSLNKEYCIIHYPKKPNGFGILLIGPGTYDIQEGNLRIVNQHRKYLIEDLCNEGYTVFFTNLDNNHLGNSVALEQVKDLYEHVKRNEILNEKIHLIAEDVGALLVKPFLNEKQHFVRSIIFINPVFSLKWIIDDTLNQPFLFKKLLHDLKKTYHLSDEECEKFIKNQQNEFIYLTTPYKIIHILGHGKRDEEQINRYQQMIRPISDRIQVVFPEKQYKISTIALKLFKEAEKQL